MKYVSAASLLQAFRQWSEYKKKKRGEQILLLLLLCCFLLDVTHYLNSWNRLCRPRESSVNCVSSILATNSCADVNYCYTNIQLWNLSRLVGFNPSHALEYQRRPQKCKSACTNFSLSSSHVLFWYTRRMPFSREIFQLYDKSRNPLSLIAVLWPISNFFCRQTLRALKLV